MNDEGEAASGSTHHSPLTTVSPLRLILCSLCYYRRTNMAVVLGVAAATAVLTGALLVGDSMRGSLRDLTLRRLGPIDEVLRSDRFFREQLAGELSDGLAARPSTAERFSVVPAILLDASVENVYGGPAGTQANGVQVIGASGPFWGTMALWHPQDAGEPRIVLNQPLADRLGVYQGADVILRLPGQGSIAGDSALGRKRDTVRGVRMTVGAVVPIETWLGRFALRPNQQVPLNCYVPLEALQGYLKQPGRVNAILVAGHHGRPEPPPDDHETLVQSFHPSPVDYGIQVEPVQRGDFSYLNVTTQRLLFEPAVEAAIGRALRGERLQPVLAYLANTIDREGRDRPATSQDDRGRIVPYSIVAALDFAEREPLGPFRTPEGRAIPPLDDRDGPQIVLNAWAAKSLGIRADAPEKTDVYLTFFEPESAQGQGRQRTQRFRLAAVADLAGPAKDRAFTPIVPGLTDKRSINAWDVPFSPFFRGLIRRDDETYYRQHGLTPKAFVSLAAGRRLWGSRFGQTTSFRVAPSPTATVEKLTARIGRELDPAGSGFVFQSVKSQGLAASQGTTPFSLLFLGFSMFIIAAAVMLVALLFRLGIDARAEQLGILLAVGLGRRRVTWIVAAEGLLVAALGSLLGTLAGFGYAALMLAGLRTLWLAAIVTPFLQLHWTWTSLAVGLASGLAVAMTTIVWAVWRAGKTPCLQLLAGQIAGPDRGTAPVRRGSPDPAETPDRRSPRVCETFRGRRGSVGDRPQPGAKGTCPLLRCRSGRLAAALVAVAVLVGLFAVRLSEMAQAGAFFGSGTLVLAAALAVVGGRLRAGATGPAVAAGRGNLLRLALRNAARNPGRSTLSVGLVAAVSFLIVAISAFRLDPTAQTPTLASGNGGFALVAESVEPIYEDLNTPEGRRAIGGLSDAELKRLDDARIKVWPLRVKPGDDASCLNLYQPRQPRILGLPQALIERGGFAWSGTLAETEAERLNPWLLLDKDPGADADGTLRVPVVLEANTAQYSLHRGLGDTLDVHDDQGRTLRLRIVGLLANSILQGDLLMSETAMLKRFPGVSGYRFFLIETQPEQVAAVQGLLERALGDYGFAAQTSAQRLAGFLAVQNTYLSTFQSLGGLGLLLGTFGLAAVQLRGVLERRRELALLRAAGFRRRTLAWLVALENGLVLAAGLGCGVIAALVAVLPHLLGGRAQVPWASLAGTLALVLAVGLAAGLSAVRAALRAPLLESLRGE
jgi:putative ABC transport system permease protein